MAVDSHIHVPFPLFGQSDRPNRPRSSVRIPDTHTFIVPPLPSQVLFDRYKDDGILDYRIATIVYIAVEIIYLGLLHDLGNSYLRQFERLGNLADLECALSFWKCAAEHIVTDPKVQIRCARSWAEYSSLLDRSPLPASEWLMTLILHTIRLGTTTNQHCTPLKTVADLATEAASRAISVQKYDLALEWLEQGRYIVWNQILHPRTPMDDLSAVNVPLAQRLNGIASQLLEGAGSRHVTTSSLGLPFMGAEDEAQHHRRLADEWEQLLGQVRNIPGFKHFLRPRKVEGLKLAATDGPVVLINTHTIRIVALRTRAYKLTATDSGALAGLIDTHTTCIRVSRTRVHNNRHEDIIRLKPLEPTRSDRWSACGKPLGSTPGFGCLMRAASGGPWTSQTTVQLLSALSTPELPCHPHRNLPQLLLSIASLVRSTFSFGPNESEYRIIGHRSRIRFQSIA